jgi:superfamily II DNA or RNA helicase
MARQALHLARALSPDEKVEFEPRLPHESGELLLAYLLEREPEWRRALRALEQFTETAEHRETVVSRRVAWFLDMSCGELAKPALDEYREGSGWSRGQRVDFDVLRAHQSELPPEDIAVLTAIDSAPRLNRIPPEAVEALCGHPRVFNGARGRKPVEVVRGRCRIETAEEHGHFVIRIEPAGAEVGVHVVVENESRVVVYRVDSALAKLIQLIPTGIRIPQSEKREGLAVLSRLAEHVAIDSPELGVLRTVVADSCPCIRISPEAGAWWIEIGVRPFGENGRFFPPGLGKSLVTVHSDEDVLDTERNLNEELRRFNALLEACPTLDATLTREKEVSDQSGDPSYTASLDEEELFSLLSELRAKKTDYCLEWKQGRAVSARGKLTASSLQGALRRIKGWYLLDGSVEIDAVTPLALAELVRMPFTKSGRFIRLPTGDFVEVERRVAEVLSRLANVVQLPVQGVAREIKVPEAAVDVLRLLSETESGIVVEAEARDWLARLDSFLAIEPALPDGLRATLRPYQVDGYRWLWRYSQVGLGVCLADDMGLGKTLQVIALLLTRATGGPAIVIAPTSVCSNWLEELRRFAPSLNAVEYVGKSRSALIERFKRDGETRAPDVIIASYALLQQDVTTLASVEWNTAVLDEAQFIKNPHSQRAKAAFALSARYRVAMTGTPIENHLGDLWSVFHFLNPSLLGSLKHFQLRYVKPIERERDSAQQARLKKLVQPFMLRRRKEEVLLDLPSMTVMRHEVRLNDDESLRYALLRRQINEKLRDPAVKRDHKLEVLAEITRLRRFCCHPRLVFPDAPTESSKVQAFLELAEDLRANGHRALVFSQFVDFLGLIREQLDERQVRYLYLDGSTPKDARQVRVQEFQNGDVELFLISLKAGGFGLNLTGADYVIHLDPWWNPAVEAQATDRAHRIGQKRPVTVYRLVTKDSIEERIVELHREKRAIANALLDEASVVTALSSSELMELLSMD